MATGTQTGTGTPGANQNGTHPTGPYGSPGDVLSVVGPLSREANLPLVDLDFSSMFVKETYATELYDYLRPNLLWDQFATVAPSGLTFRGAPKRISLVDDLADATTSLLENIDIDTVALTGRYAQLTQDMYGNAIKRSIELVAQAYVPFDQIASNKLRWNALKTMNALARTAMTQATNVTYQPDGGTITSTIATLVPKYASGASTGYLSSEVIQEGIVLLEQQNVAPFRGDNYVLVVGPRGKQHVQADTNWRNAVNYNPGMSGNSPFNGSVGTWEGAEVVVDRAMPAGTALLFGAEAFAKTYPGVEGLGEYPEVIVSPVTDTLRRFGGVGWRWMGGYKIFRPQAIVKITHVDQMRWAADVNTSITETAYAEVLA